MAAAPRYTLPIKRQLHFAGFTPSKVMKWVPTLALWGGAAAGIGALFLSEIPLFQKDVLNKIPGIAAYYKDDTPDSDKPF